MTTAEAREVLIRYNTWRRYNGPLDQTPLQPEPKEIGEAIDVAIEVLPEEEAEEASLDEAACDHIRKVADAAGHPGWGWTTQDIADAFIAGANYRRLKRLAEAAKSSSHLDAYTEGVRRSIEKQIGQLPPPPPGYYYTWELDTIRKEGQSFTAIARPLLKQINPEHDEYSKPNIDAGIDLYFYGKFFHYDRKPDAVYVYPSPGTSYPGTPVEDWMEGQTVMNPSKLRAFAKYFYDRGKESKDNQK